MAHSEKNIHDIMEEYDRLHYTPINVTNDITHDEFVVGVHNKTIGFTTINGELITLVKGARKAIFNILVLLYLIAPSIIIPLWAYHESNWWLLLGILVASLISPQLAQRGENSIGGLLLLACIIFWFRGGIHNYFTFFSLCALWGYMFFQMAEAAQTEYAMQSLVENPDLFNEAIAQKRI